MFRRLFWLVLGVALGILIWRKLTKVAHDYSPHGLAERAQAGAARSSQQARAFVGDVRQLSAEREAAIRREISTKNPVRDPAQRHAGHRRDGRQIHPPNRHGD